MEDRQSSSSLEVSLDVFLIDFRVKERKGTVIRRRAGEEEIIRKILQVKNIRIMFHMCQKNKRTYFGMSLRDFHFQFR